MLWTYRRLAVFLLVPSRVRLAQTSQIHSLSLEEDKELPQWKGIKRGDYSARNEGGAEVIRLWISGLFPDQPICRSAASGFLPSLGPEQERCPDWALCDNSRSSPCTRTPAAGRT